MDSGRNLCTEGEARQALLRTSAGYELSTDNPNLAVYREGDVSLPDDVKDAPLIDTVLSAETRRWLNEDVGEFVLSEEAVGAEEERRGPAGAYMDPVLANDPKKYHRLLKELVEIGLFTYCRRPRATGGLFFLLRRRTVP
jgi:hypothetical protein